MLSVLGVQMTNGHSLELSGYWDRTQESWFYCRKCARRFATYAEYFRHVDEPGTTDIHPVFLSSDQPLIRPS